MSEFPLPTPHGPITKVFDRVYVVQGTVDFKPLVRLTRQMVVLVSDGELTLINSVRLSEKGEKELEALGKVAHVMKIGGHGMDDPYYVDRYGAKSWALEGATLAGGLTADHTITVDGDLPVAGMKAFLFEHTNKPEAWLLVDWHDGLLLTCDSVQNWVDTKGCSVMAKGITRLMGFIKPAQIGPPWRKVMTPDGGSLRPDFERMAALPFKHLFGGHGVPLLDVAQDKLAQTIRRTYGEA